MSLDVDVLLSNLGLTLLPAFTSTVKWLAARPRVQAPALPLHIVEKGVREVWCCGVREAPAVPFEAVRVFEGYVTSMSLERPLLAAFGWQCLWASMRFDDALHTTPSSIDPRD